MTLNGQCLKSVDKPIKLINVELNQLINATEKSPIMTSSLSDALKESKNVLLIISPDINTNVYDYILNLCENKKLAIISENIPLQYIDYQTILNKDNIENYDFFGACAGRAPMLINKQLYDYDLIIVISSVIMNAYSGFLGSVTTLFNVITAPKTVATVIKNALQDSIYNIQKLSSGLTIRNPIYESIREGIIATGKAINTYAINIEADYLNKSDTHSNIFAGDMFLSQIEAQNIILEQHKLKTPATLYEGIDLYIKCYDNIAYFVTMLEYACKKVLKGGRVRVNIDSMASFGNQTFQEVFYKNTLTDIADAVDESNYMESFYAFLLKYYALNYHIALPYNEKLNTVLIQAGLNPLKEDELKSFLDNCHNKGII